MMRRQNNQDASRFVEFQRLEEQWFANGCAPSNKSEKVTLKEASDQLLCDYMRNTFEIGHYKVNRVYEALVLLQVLTNEAVFEDAAADLEALNLDSVEAAVVLEHDQNSIGSLPTLSGARPNFVLVALMNLAHLTKNINFMFAAARLVDFRLAATDAERFLTPASDNQTDYALTVFVLTSGHNREAAVEIAAERFSVPAASFAAAVKSVKRRVSRVEKFYKNQRQLVDRLKHVAGQPSPTIGKLLAAANIRLKVPRTE